VLEYPVNLDLFGVWLNQLLIESSKAESPIDGIESSFWRGDVLPNEHRK
jgi:hypothetical protein